MINKLYMLDGRHLRMKKGSFDLKTKQFTGDFLELLPAFAPSVTITESLESFEATTNDNSDAQTYSIVASNIFAAFKIYAPTQFSLSLDGFSWANSVSITPSDGAFSQTVYVRLNTGVAGTYLGNILHESVAYSSNIAVSGTITQAPDERVYGFLYNWYAVDDARGIANGDYDVLTDAEWTWLTDYIDAEIAAGRITATGAGGALKETGTVYWDPPNTGAVNAIGFNARGGGERNNSGSFRDIRSVGKYWSSTEDSSSNAWARRTFKDSAIIERRSRFKVRGYSVRLIRPATPAEKAAHEDGDFVEIYTGNDGKHYGTIYVGKNDAGNGYVILADNLAETKFANGDWIAGFDGGTYTPISNANWAELTTGALCAYDDDLDNV